MGSKKKSDKEETPAKVRVTSPETPKRIVPTIMIKVTKEKKYIPIVKKNGELVFTGKEHDEVKNALEEASNFCKEHTNEFLCI